LNLDKTLAIEFTLPLFFVAKKICLINANLTKY